MFVKNVTLAFWLQDECGLNPGNLHVAATNTLLLTANQEGYTSAKFRYISALIYEIHSWAELRAMTGQYKTPYSSFHTFSRNTKPKEVCES